jgi:hypothetical protein
MYNRIVRTLATESSGARDADGGESGLSPTIGSATATLPDPRSGPAAVAGSSDDARGERRITAHGGATAVVAGKPLPVRVRDVSRNGFGLLMVSPVEPGQQFAVSLAGAGAMAGLSIVCSTAYCRPAGHGLYAVGARLVRFSPKRSS